MVRDSFPLVRPSRAFPSRVFTSAEVRVALRLKLGLTNKEIANELGRQEPTVKNQVASILTKLGVSNRGRAIAALHQPQATEFFPEAR